MTLTICLGVLLTDVQAQIAIVLGATTSLSLASASLLSERRL